jgi:hypothetical protein
MIHARADYNRIQDPAGLIPEDEPVFLIRAQDETSALTVEKWAEYAEQAGADWSIVKAARDHAAAMRGYQRKHGCKIPDMPDPAPQPK